MVFELSSSSAPLHVPLPQAASGVPGCLRPRFQGSPRAVGRSSGYLCALCLLYTSPSPRD
eukprot:3500154-Alexandrium_andersonii.AAC.1